MDWIISAFSSCNGILRYWEFNHTQFPFPSNVFGKARKQLKNHYAIPSPHSTPKTIFIALTLTSRVLVKSMELFVPLRWKAFSQASLQLDCGQNCSMNCWWPILLKDAELNVNHSRVNLGMIWFLPRCPSLNSPRNQETQMRGILSTSVTTSSAEATSRRETQRREMTSSMKRASVLLSLFPLLLAWVLCAATTPVSQVKEGLHFLCTPHSLLLSDIMSSTLIFHQILYPQVWWHCLLSFLHLTTSKESSPCKEKCLTSPSNPYLNCNGAAVCNWHDLHHM